MAEMIRFHLSRDERDDKRQKLISRIGYDPTIPEATFEEIQAYIAQFWNIERIEFTGIRVVFCVMPLMTMTRRKLNDAESYLMKTYGNDPHKLATFFSEYQLVFIAN